MIDTEHDIIIDTEHDIMIDTEHDIMIDTEHDIMIDTEHDIIIRYRTRYHDRYRTRYHNPIALLVFCENALLMKLTVSKSVLNQASRGPTSLKQSQQQDVTAVTLSDNRLGSGRATTH